MKPSIVVDQSESDKLQALPKADRQATNERNRYRAIFENMAEPAFAVGPDGVVIAVNQAMERLSGFPRKEMEGRKCEDIFSEGLCKAFPLQGATGERASFTDGETTLNIGGCEKTLLRRGVSLYDVHGMYTEGIAILQDITECKRLEEKLHTLSVMDELTGLYNRRGFVTSSQQQFRLGERSKRNMLLLHIDFDGLEEINDRRGPAAGDLALQEVASVLRETFRDSDIIGRIGGDKFAVLCIETMDMASQTVGKRLQHGLEIANAKRANLDHLSLSIGMALYNAENPSSLDELMAEADKLMQAKKRMKSR